MSDSYIQRLEDVRPGDIFLGPIGGAVGAGIRLAQILVDGGWRVGPLHVEHIGIVVEAASPDFQDRSSVERASVTGHGPRMVQAMASGAEEIELTYAKHWTPSVAYARIPEDYPGQAADAAAIARLMVEHKVAYSFASYAALALYRWGWKAPRLTKWIGRRGAAVEMPHWSNGPTVQPYPGWTRGGRLPLEAICSVLADQSWSLAGKRVMHGTAPQAVTPSQLGTRLLTGMDGVVWGWPIAHPHP